MIHHETQLALDRVRDSIVWRQGGRTPYRTYSRTKSREITDLILLSDRDLPRSEIFRSNLRNHLCALSTVSRVHELHTGLP